jgi:hypothetical protein
VTKTDAEAVTDTILDYFEGWFDGDTARMQRALHPELAKRRAGEELGITLASGHGKRDADARSFVHLVRTAEGWRIANALWQPS